MTQPSYSQRKRSSRVALTTMATLTGSMALTACGDAPAAPSANAADVTGDEVQVYENVFACAKETGKSRQECDEMRQAAIDRANQEAPRFAALEDCEAEFGAGQCMQAGKASAEQATAQQTSSGRSHFSPFIVAWFSSSKNGSSTPLFKSKAGGYQTANGSRLGFAGAPGKYYASNRATERAKSVPKVKPASQKARSGGFGSRNQSWNLADRNGAGRSGSSSSSARSKGG